MVDYNEVRNMKYYRKEGKFFKSLFVVSFEEFAKILKESKFKNPIFS